MWHTRKWNIETALLQRAHTQANGAAAFQRVQASGSAAQNTLSWTVMSGLQSLLHGFSIELLIQD